MAAFDPQAATRATMAMLTPAQHARATAYTHGSEWLLLWSWVVGVIVCLLILRSGMLTRLRCWIERRGKRPNRAALACGVAFSLANAVLSLPWMLYSGWARERSYGLSSQSLTGYLRDGAVAALVGAIMLGLFIVALYALIRRTPRAWWSWAGAVTAVFALVVLVIGPVAIEPLFNTYRPAPPGSMRDAVVALAQSVGVPSDKIEIYDGSRQSNRYTANVSGLFGSARIAMSDTMFAKNADLAEVRGVVGHEMGHYVLNHVLWFALFASVVAMAGFCLIDRLFAPASRLLGARGVAGLADPAGLPVLVAVLITLQLLGTPLFNTATRIEESQADAFSLAHANEPDGLSRALVKTIEYRASSPSALEEFVFYDHPSVERRVRRAMMWKATH